MYSCVGGAPSDVLGIRKSGCASGSWCGNGHSHPVCQIISVLKQLQDTFFSYQMAGMTLSERCWPTCHNCERHKAWVEHFCIEFSAAAQCQPPPQIPGRTRPCSQPRLCKPNSCRCFKRWKERCVCLPLMLHSCTPYFARKARCVLDLLADLSLALQYCRFFGEQHSSFLCCYFKAGFLLPLITDTVCKLRTFHNLNLDMRALRDPCIHGKIYAFAREGWGVKIKSTWAFCPWPTSRV